MHEKYKIITPISHVPVCHPCIFWDNGDCTFNYEATGDGGDWSAAYNTAAAHSCLQGIRLCTRATSPAQGDVVSISKHLWLPPTFLITLDLLFGYPTHSTLTYFHVGLLWYDGTNQNAILLRFEQSAGTVSYLSAPLTYTVIPGLVHCPTAKTWNHLRVSAMLRGLYYQYIEVNNVVIDARTFPILSQLDATIANLTLWLAAETRTAAVRCVDIDHILLMPGNP